MNSSSLAVDEFILIMEGNDELLTTRDLVDAVVVDGDDDDDEGDVVAVVRLDGGSRTGSAIEQANREGLDAMSLLLALSRPL